MAHLELELSCNTALRCKCGSQSFRIFMEVDEDSNELSDKDANGVECDACHELFQIKLVRSDPPHSQEANAPVTVEQLDKLQFGRVLHERPKTDPVDDGLTELQAGENEEGRT
jgi:hypothetical protein